MRTTRARHKRHRRAHARDDPRHDERLTGIGKRPQAERRRVAAPPPPPLRLTVDVACDPSTEPDVLWHIAREAPELRMWLIANTAATPELLEFVAQAGGPGVKRAFDVLFESMEDDARTATA